MNIKALSLNFSGTVQGVGFRPYLFQLAFDLNLKGQIKNNTDGVSAYLEGKEDHLALFLKNLTKNPPVNAKIDLISKNWEKPKGLQNLSIDKSEVNNTSIISTPPDLATCDACFKEFRDPKNRRFNYPLISCTDCGPRYTVTRGLPFDREKTAYHDFPLCKECKSEYLDPKNRRYHAQTTGCTKCGPNITPINFNIHEFLSAGNILGLKGVGGYQLICDAKNIEAINKLRARKNRPHRPLAVMAQNLDLIKKISNVTIGEEKLLTSAIAPIVILPLKNKILPKIISPDHESIGFFLPTTPLHQMLFNIDLEYLIVTSANEIGSPIALDLENLTSLADGNISHNRPIISRADDSVYQGVDLVRPGRGIAPLVFTHSKRVNKSILALGADLKNTFCISKGHKSYLSPHVGDLYNFPTYLDFQKQIKSFAKLLNLNPEIIAVDLHPNYLSSTWGRDLAKERGIKLIEVQHHHAHALACMEEHNLEEAYAFTFDGTGYGLDGTLWGGELLHVYPGGFKRKAHLKPFLLPGGEKAILDPLRQLMARHFEMGLPVDPLLKKICEKKINTFETSSVGRLFDQVSALLDIQTTPITYEGQAAIRLENMARQAKDLSLKSFNFSDKKFDTLDILREMQFEKNNGAPIPVLAYRFHYTMAKIAIKMLEGLKTLPIVFCGGVFQNKLLLSMLEKEIKGLGLKSYSPHKFPPNDGGISFGQAVFVRQILE